MCIVICTLLLSRPARGAWVEICSRETPQGCYPRRAPQGARGLKLFSYLLSLLKASCRAPQGARGLKYKIFMAPVTDGAGSRPARGAWVEISGAPIEERMVDRRAPQGARGLKYLEGVLVITCSVSRPARGAWVEIPYPSPLDSRSCRAPQGARGLKCHNGIDFFELLSSRPARGAWVEIFVITTSKQKSRSRPARGAWVEIL